MAWQNEMLNHHAENGKPYSLVYLRTLHNQLLKQILGAEQIEATLNAAKQQEKEQKRSRRSFER